MRVYGQYDQAQLDAQYDNARAVPDRERWTERWPTESAAVRARLEARLDVAYGAAPRERLDIFPVPGNGAPVMIFIHGGYWRMRSKEDFSFVVPAYVAAGIAVAVISYPLAPQATLEAIVESARRAVAWVSGNAASFGGDKGRIHLAGYSAGGHLAAMALSTDWAARGLPADVLKSGCAVSGIYDLEPFRHSVINADVGVNAETVARTSPISLIPAQAGPLLLTVGGRETDEFRRQTEIYAEAWHRAGLPLAILPMPKDHHYSIMDGFANPASPLFQALKRQIFGA